MRKNITRGISGTQAIHDTLATSRGNIGRKAGWSASTRRIQWMKRLSGKRVRAAIAAEMAEMLAETAAPTPQRSARPPVPGVTVVTRGKGMRVLAREERAFTSPSLSSLIWHERKYDFEDFIAEKALMRSELSWQKAQAAICM
jgi:hypothetical protein